MAILHWKQGLLNDKDELILKAMSLTPFYQTIPTINPLPCHKILDWPKLKAFVDHNLNVAKMNISL